MNNQSETPSIQPQQWISQFTNHNQHQLKQSLMDFLIHEGLYDVAKCFSTEARIQMPFVDEDEVRFRYQVKKYIEDGLIDQAIQQIYSWTNKHQSHYNPFHNHSNQQLLFKIKSLKVINLIKANLIQQSIQTAKKQLLPYATQYMEEIEKVMSLIAFINCKQSPNYYLTSHQYRVHIASTLNNLLIHKQQNKLATIIKVTRWCEKRLQKYVNFPKCNMESDVMYK